MRSMRWHRANPTKRLGIEIAKTMSMNYSNQETSVTVGESIRDEDGTDTTLTTTIITIHLTDYCFPRSLHITVYRPR